MLYKSPQTAYPYADLVRVNARRDQTQPEFELFTAVYRAEPAALHILLRLWYPNTWSWRARGGHERA